MGNIIEICSITDKRCDGICPETRTSDRDCPALIHKEDKPKKSKRSRRLENKNRKKDE